MPTDDYPDRPMTAPMDFMPRPSAAFAAAFSEHLDTAIKAAKDSDDAAYRSSTPTANRPAIGAGRLGNECLRAIAYEFHRAPKDGDRGFSGRLYRIFDRGHWGEEAMARYLRLAGFTLLTENAAGKQFRYDIAQYEDGKGRVKGMIDGVITAGPAMLRLPDGSGFAMRYPLMWENKELGSKSWKKLEKGGLRAYGGDYFPQVQMGMFHLGLAENPALFTCKNADTQEIYAELIPADPAFIQASIDKAVRVIATADPEELPRVAAKAADFRCKFCDYAARCWREPKPATPEAGAWSFGQ